jgi:uncharacterized protein YdhG (YjbR/CyaY superfamily)
MKVCSSVDEYLEALPEATRLALQTVRDAIRRAEPRAEESISYDMPTYKLNGERLLYFAGWKKHYSLYPATPEVLAAFRDELAEYKVEKRTIQFPLAEPVPVKLIERIAKFRASQVADRAATRTGKRRARAVH